jgi:hypothetical protein
MKPRLSRVRPATESGQGSSRRQTRFNGSNSEAGNRRWIEDEFVVVLMERRDIGTIRFQTSTRGLC